MHLLRRKLDELWESGAITLCDSGDRWHWDMDTIVEGSGILSIEDYYTQKMLKLPDQLDEILQICAAFGPSFDTRVVSIVTREDPLRVGECLEQLTDMGFFVKDVVLGEFEYHFYHDDVRRIAYSKINSKDRHQVHIRIGRALLEAYSEREFKEKLFDVINHLNKSFNLLKDEKEMVELAELNLKAGLVSSQTSAYEDALSFYHKGLSLLPPNSWGKYYDLTHALYLNAAIATSICSNDEDMEMYSSEVLRYSKDDVDRLHMYEIQIQSYSIRGKPEKAVDLALKVLKEHGIKFKKRPSKLRVLLSFMRTKYYLSPSKIRKIYEARECDDAYQIAIMNIMLKMGTAAYFVAPELQVLSTFKRVRHSYKYGLSPSSLLAYGAYALILCGVFGRYEEGYKFGKMSLEILDRLKNDEYKARVYLYFNAFVRVWKEPLRKTLQPLLDGISAGLDYGDIDYVAYLSFIYSSLGLLSGQPIEKIRPNVEEHNSYLEDHNHVNGSEINSVFIQVFMNLSGEAENPAFLDGLVCKSDATIELFKSKNSKTGLGGIYLVRQYLAYLFGDYERSEEESKLRERFKEGVRSTFLTAFGVYIEVLNLLAMCRSSQGLSKRRYLKRVRRGLKLLQRLSSLCEGNVKSKEYLILAQLEALDGEEESAMHLYDQSIQFARSQELLNDEALGCELAAEYLVTIGVETEAVRYYKMSMAAYGAWGAKAKVMDVKTKLDKVV